MMHATAWWLLGYSAIPIPILIPPIIGITIGDKPKNKSENVIISLAPLLLSLSAYIQYQATNNQFYLTAALVNVSGMLYDFCSIFW